MGLRIQPIGFNLLVKLDDVEDTVKLTEGVDFILSPDDREKTVIIEGEVLAISDGCFSDKPDGQYPVVGSRVVIKKYAGSEIVIDSESGETARLLVDEDVIAIINE